MKKTILCTILLIVGSCLVTSAQILRPVTWSYAAKKTGPKEAMILIKAGIDKSWHLYSQFLKEGGPVKTTITFYPSTDYIIAGSTIEPKPIIRMENVFGMEVRYFENSVVFQQKIKLKKDLVTVKGTVEYMTCNDEKCLPPATEEFTIKVK